MTNLEISDGKITNYFFKELFENDNCKRIGILFSSGTDSTLILFFLAKFIDETESFDKIIFPWVGLELNNKLSFIKEKSILILNLIRKMYPRVDIRDIHFDSWMRVSPYEHPTHKNRYSNPLSTQFKIENNLDIFLSGITSNPPKEVRDFYEMVTEHCASGEHRNPENVNTHEYWQNMPDDNIPWKKYDKKFVAHQYKKYNLMENLYPLTQSCVIETVEVLLNIGSTTFPCKKCFWCREKYWAFGSYDGGIQ